MTQLAARVSDPHTCPVHTGGPILPPGYPTVLIGSQPAARVNDLCQCKGPPDMIRSGAPTVLIGGRPAARKGDVTRHAGVIDAGHPTVIMGPALSGDAVDAIFTDAYLATLVDREVQGANTKELKEAMDTLYEHRHDPNSPEVAEALKKIAEARGKPLSEIQEDWARYQAALAEQERIAAAKGIEPPPGINTWLHPNFMGSPSQLRYGQVVGDALGMDPVFGALLNPTGGLVGPGNKAVDGNDSALGYHGAVHDAGGYLYNYHDQGPGYDYLGLEGRDPGDPLTGQRAGISYWRDHLPDRSTGQKVTDGLGDGVMEGVVGGIDKAKEVYGEAKEKVSDAYEGAKEKVSDTYEKAKDKASELWDGLWD